MGAGDYNPVVLIGVGLAVGGRGGRGGAAVFLLLETFVNWQQV